MKSEKIKIKRYVYVLVLDDCYEEDSNLSVIGVYMDKEDAKNKMASAICFGVPNVPKGVSSFRASNVSEERWAFISVAITPGATQFTCILEGPNSLANALVNPMIAAFAAE